MMPACARVGLLAPFCAQGQFPQLRHLGLQSGVGSWCGRAEDRRACLALGRDQMGSPRPAPSRTEARGTGQGQTAEPGSERCAFPSQ